VGSEKEFLSQSRKDAKGFITQVIIFFVASRGDGMTSKPTTAIPSLLCAFAALREI